MAFYSLAAGGTLLRSDMLSVSSEYGSRVQKVQGLGTRVDIVPAVLLVVLMPDSVVSTLMGVFLRR
jgi:hypothetical protein